MRDCSWCGGALLEDPPAGSSDTRGFCCEACEVAELLDGTSIPQCRCGLDGRHNSCPFDWEIHSRETPCTCCYQCRKDCEWSI